MSLRAFHLLFIGLCVVLAAFMAAWAAGQYQLEANPGYLATALASILTGGGLTVYVMRPSPSYQRVSMLSRSGRVSRPFTAPRVGAGPNPETAMPAGHR